MFRSTAKFFGNNAIALMAFFIAMTGTAGAATAMWTGANIVDGTLTGADVQNGSLTGADIQPGSVTAADLAPGAASAEAPLLTFDSGTTSYDQPSFVAGDPTTTYTATTTLTSATFNQPTSGFVDVRLVGSETVDSNALCSDTGQSGFGSVSMTLDGGTAPFGNVSFNDSGASQGPSSVWLAAGTHQVHLIMTSYVCSGAITGQIHITDVHIEATGA